jgi:hypothetical protein
MIQALRPLRAGSDYWFAVTNNAKYGYGAQCRFGTEFCRGIG